ncbi:MAG: hypothetical protein A2036_03940 [Omnitrophica bacterium GWA2_50_21]|nr:MAG: hypothetical protein A2036_03940 [Omnitrophica bacterium GWA2_50_21]
MGTEAMRIEREIRGDEEYMERYSDIGRLYCDKRTLLRGGQGDKDAAVEGGIAELNERIKTTEDAFLGDVSRELARGRKFSFEILARKFGLKTYEKRMLLFFLFLEFFHVKNNLCFEMELLELMDLENSPFGRMRDFRYFKKDATLFRSRLLVGEEIKDESFATFSLGLSGFALDIFSTLMSGEEIEEEDSRKRPESDCDAVGAVKEPEYRFEDVVLKDDIRDKVAFFLSAFKEPAMDMLGIAGTIKKGKGLNFLFYGPPGTGKSMLAEGIAGFLEKKLLLVETPKIFSRWVGETDKAIASIFSAAKKNNLVICMDEADSLLYNRLYAGQEHDIRFVNVMLQEIERYDGIAIFTTNLDSLLDPALERRISLRIKFELPDEKMRLDIWKSHIPPSVKLAEDVNFTDLVRRFEFSGGYIKNAVLNALRKVVFRKEDTITMDDLVWAANMEKEGLFNKELHNKVAGFTAQG